MLRYIIDGWNLIYKIPEIKSNPDAKDALIHFIKKNRLTGSKNNKVTIVFDGKIDLSLIQAEREFEIIFSDTISADELIRRRVRKQKSTHDTIVVSNDREIASHIKDLGARSMKVEAFLNSRKRRRTHSKDGDDIKDISYRTQAQITEELRKIWLDD